MNYVIFQQNTVSGIKRPDWDAMYDYDTIQSEERAKEVCEEINRLYAKKREVEQYVAVYGTEKDLADWEYGYEKVGGQQYEFPEYHIYVKNMVTGACRECTGKDPRVQPCASAQRAAERVAALNKEFSKQLAAKNCQYIYHEPMIAIY